MAIDRAATPGKAEKLLRQKKLDAATAGDVRQFERIAGLSSQGIVPRARG